MHRLLLDAAPASELEWSDFDHVARNRDHIERVITDALASGAPGVNILLYGPPGTGKTEFCKVLAERLDRELRIERTAQRLTEPVQPVVTCPSVKAAGTASPDTYRRRMGRRGRASGTSPLPQGPAP